MQAASCRRRPITSVALYLLVTVALLVCLQSREALPAQWETLTLDDLTRRAAVIVEGTVTTKRAEWNPEHTRIYTSVTLSADQYYKGDLGQSVLNLRLLGGNDGEITMAVSGQANFVVGERVVLFLAPNFELRDFPTVNGEAGKLDVTVEPTTGKEFLEGPQLRVARDDALATILQIMAPFER